MKVPTLELAASRFMMSEQGSRRPMPDEIKVSDFILLVFFMRVCVFSTLVITFYCAFLTLREF